MECATRYSAEYKRAHRVCHDALEAAGLGHQNYFMPKLKIAKLHFGNVLSSEQVRSKSVTKFSSSNDWFFCSFVESYVSKIGIDNHSNMAKVSSAAAGVSKAPLTLAGGQ